MDMKHIDKTIEESFLVQIENVALASHENTDLIWQI